MNNHLLIFGISVLLICVGLSGCFDGNDKNNGSSSNGSTGNIVTMNASELHEDRKDVTWGRSTMYGPNWDNYSRDYESVDEGDTLVIVDYVTEMIYYWEKDKTRIDLSDPTVGFYFNGNVENSFSIGDKVRITVTIKYINISFTSNNVYRMYDVEIFEEQWVDEEYFIEHRFTAPLPTSCIEVI